MEKSKKQLSKLIREAPQKPSNESGPDIVNKCKTCDGSGFEMIQGMGVRRCKCLRELLRQKNLAVIPPKFQNSVLARLIPRPYIHPLQAELIPFVQKNPSRSYFLAGRPGCGKTMLSWSLYRHAVESGDNRIIACTFAEWIREIHGSVSASKAGLAPKSPRLNADELRQRQTKYSIFLDDLDKERPTEYSLSQLFEVVNAVYEYEHQLVVTTNLTVSQLIDHFNRVDIRFGDPILRRLTVDTEIFEMF